MRFLALAGALLLAACASLWTPPSVSLAGVDIESLGLFEQRFLLKLRVTNPNAFDIPVEGLDFVVELNGRHFADGISKVGVIIPGGGETVLAVRASSNLAAFLRQWKDFEKGGRSALDYRVKGTIRVSGRGELPFDRRGEVDLPRLPLPEPKPRPTPGTA